MAAKNRNIVYSTDPDEDRSTPAKTNLPVNPAAPLPTLQQNKPVIVSLERKGRGGKQVSLISGVMSPIAGKKALLKLLKSKLGAGGAIKGDHLEIQGDRRDDIVTMLIELGYQAKRSGG